MSSGTPSIESLTSRDRMLTVMIASSGLFLVALDFSINVSLPTMRDSLGASLISVQGIIIFYHASRSGLAPAAGGLGDAFGLKRVFLWGVVAYTAAVGLIALQDTLGAVVALRVLQGVGAGILFTAGPALVVRAFGPARRGTALGVTLASVSAGQMTATLGGGFLS
ncbi:MAG: MFS transporter, partial [Chloroflexi bacterium]|nr:MFS transporter [Chloroflexota bacterium]